MDHKKIVIELCQIAAEAESVGPYLEAVAIEAVLLNIVDECIESDGQLIPQTIKDLDKRLEDAMRADTRALYERILSVAEKNVETI